MLPAQSQYDDRMLDSLGSQRYTEAQIIYNRQLNEFEERIKELDEQRRNLEASLAAGAYEQDKTGGGADSAEAGRIEEFQAATQASQARVAQEAASAATRQALIENARDRELVEAERKAAQRLAEAADEEAAKRALEAQSAANRTSAAVLDAQTRHADADSQLILGETRAKNEEDRLIAQAEARAASRIAEIEANSARQVSEAEARINQEIASKKQTDALTRVSAAKEAARAHSEESKLLDQQRITVALANAEAERRTAEDIAAQQKVIDQHRADTQAMLAPLSQEIEQRKVQIAELNRQIASLESQMASVAAQQELLLAPQMSKLEQLQAESVRLAQVSEKLRAAPLLTPPTVVDAGPSAEALQFVAAKEAELARFTAGIQAQQGSQVAEIRSGLASEIASIRASTRSTIASLQTGTARSKAAISPAAAIPATSSADAMLGQTKREALIKADLAAEKAAINARARTEIARISGAAEMAKASVIAPVVTGRAVYAGSYGEKPTAYASKTSSSPTPQKRVQERQVAKAESPRPTEKPIARPAPLQAPIQVVAKFEPKEKPAPQVAKLSDVGNVILSSQVASAGGVQPIVVAPKTRTAYNVVYLYKDKASADKFVSYLKAYGVNDFETVKATSSGEYVIHAGRYYDAASAARRLTFLNKTTSTSHAKVIQEEVAR